MISMLSIFLKFLMKICVEVCVTYKYGQPIVYTNLSFQTTYEPIREPLCWQH